MENISPLAGVILTVSAMVPTILIFFKDKLVITMNNSGKKIPKKCTRKCTGKQITQPVHMLIVLHTLNSILRQFATRIFNSA